MSLTAPPEPQMEDPFAGPNAPAKSPWHMLRRQGWMLWGSAFLVMLALTATIPLLYWALAQSLANPSGIEAQAYMVIVGLAGLVLVFCLYTALKQRELESTRAELVREEADRELVRTRLSELSALFQVANTLHLELSIDMIL